MLKGVKHYGYYPEGNRRLSLSQSQNLMEIELGKTLALKKGAKVLDAGCGEGFVAMHLAKEFGYEMTGIDLLDWSIKAANKNKKSADLNSIDFRIMDYSETNFPDNSFDGIYTIETFMHTPDHRKTLKEFKRILKPGGVLVNFEYALNDNLPKDHKRDWKLMFSACPMEDAFANFRISKMKGIWEKNGFNNVSIREMTSNMEPFMRRLYLLAFIPYNLLKLFGKERNYINTFAGVRSYQLRDEYHYLGIKAHKPR